VEARRGLLRVLGRLGDARAAAAIRKDLNRKDLDTVPLAARAAGQIGDREAIPRLRKLLGNSYGPARYESALALGLLGDVESAPVFRRWLTKRGDGSYRGTAARVLAQLTDKESIPALEKALEAEPVPWVREEMKKALGALRPGKKAQ
jgi:HEAT repeat protein